MNSTLLQNLIVDAESSSQFVGGLVIALLYVVIGLLSAIGISYFSANLPRTLGEQIFWTSFLS
jgi:hypothetical protein